MVNVMIEWLHVAGYRKREIQSLVDGHLKLLILRHFDPTKADLIFTEEGSVRSSEAYILHTIKHITMLFFGFSPPFLTVPLSLFLFFLLHSSSTPILLLHSSSSPILLLHSSYLTPPFFLFPYLTPPFFLSYSSIIPLTYLPPPSFLSYSSILPLTYLPTPSFLSTIFLLILPLTYFSPPSFLSPIFLLLYFSSILPILLLHPSISLLSFLL